MWRRGRPKRTSAAGGLGDSGGEPSGDGNQRLHRTVTAIDKVDIVARVPGFIEERNFTEGQQVKKGDLLFRIEQATYKAAVEQARATLAKAKATEVNAKLQLERGKELVRKQQYPASHGRPARGGRGRQRRRA